MEDTGNGKMERVLGIYTQLLDGQIVNKTAEAQRYGVNERSIQRDIDDIRNFLELSGSPGGRSTKSGNPACPSSLLS